MKRYYPLLLLATASAPIDHPRVYLASIVNLPLRAGEQMERFSIDTWGVEFRVVCHIPGGWRIKAGSSATPDGVLEGEGSQRATWFNSRNPVELRNVALVVVYGDVQLADILNGPDATFQGHAVMSGPDDERRAALGYRNVRLTPAKRCP